MSEYGITKTGVRIKRFDTILEEINSDQTEGFGVQVGSNTRSFLNVLNTSMADKIAEPGNSGRKSTTACRPCRQKERLWTTPCSLEETAGRRPGAPTIPSTVNVRRALPWRSGP